MTPLFMIGFDQRADGTALVRSDRDVLPVRPAVRAPAARSQRTPEPQRYL